jgi:3-hydroxy-9,10-secoandrosta-1,3,5(10)-triene-9,17-dione monooxygenase
MTTSSQTIATKVPEHVLRQQLVDAIHNIGPLLKENAGTSDKDRRVPEASITALRESGAWSLSTLAQYGGYDTTGRTLFDVARAIGRYDASAAWLTVITNGSATLINRFADSAIERVFADGPVGLSSIFAGGGTAVPENGGYRITGKWPFSSNILNADWALGAVSIEHPGGVAEPGFAIVHKSQFTVEDTWYTVGLRGTGSNTTHVNDQWVPGDQLLPAASMFDPRFEGDASQPFNRRLAPNTVNFTTISAPVLGAAEAALEYVTSFAHKRGITYSVYGRQVDSSVFVRDVAEAAMRIDSAALHLQRSIDTVDEAAATAVPLTTELRARCRGDVGSAGLDLVAAVSTLMTAHGTAAFAEAAPISRYWRDVNTGARHAFLQSNLNLEVYGDSLLGIDYAMTMV